MRIAFVAYEGSIHTQRWAEHFARHGHDVHVVTCGGCSSEPRPYTVHDLGPARMKLHYFVKTWAAREAIRDIDPDVVHAHFATSYGLLGLAAKVHPFVVTAHGSDLLRMGLASRVRRWVLRRVLRSADLVTVPSEEMHTVVRALSRKRDQEVRVLQYGVECQRLFTIADWVRKPEDPALKVVSTRALHPVYRIDSLIAAVAGLRAGGLNIECDLLGDGPERKRLEQMVRGYGLQQSIRFHGQCDPEQVEQFVARADIYASVSASDGASLSLLEALALGPVPVVSDIPANRAWIDHGVNGCLVGPQPAQIAAGIEHAIGMWRERVAQINRALVLERADRETLLGGLEDRLIELTGGPVDIEEQAAPPAARAA